MVRRSRIQVRYKLVKLSKESKSHREIASLLFVDRLSVNDDVYLVEYQVEGREKDGTLIG